MTNGRPWLSIFFLMTFIAGVGSAQESLRNDILRLAKPYIDSKRVVGMSIGVIQGGEETVVHVGQTRIGGDPPNGDTVYGIGSISKVFTGILLADAVVQGKLRLDQPISELVPENVKIPDWEGSQITLADLATHRSGLPRLANNLPELATADPYEGHTAKLSYDFLNQHELRRAPGEKYEYSNFGFKLLGLLVASNAQTTYENLLKKRIAKPLDMKSTRVVRSASMNKHLATPYTINRIMTPVWTYSPNMAGHGGIKSSLNDMLRFAQAQFCEPDTDVGRALQLAWQVHTSDDSQGPKMGLGWHISTNPTDHRVHDGMTFGFRSGLYVDRKSKYAVVILANTADPKLGLLGRDLMLMLVKGVKAQPQIFRNPIDVAQAVMNSYCGTYRSTSEQEITVSLEDGVLMAQPTGGPRMRLFATSETEWFSRQIESTVQFRLKNGNCTSLQLESNGKTASYERINQPR